MIKMKIKYLFICFGILLMSCSDDFLIRDPLDRVTDVSLTFSADECRLYVNQWYPRFWGPYIFHNDLGTDNLLSTSYSNNPDLIDTRTVPSSGGGWGTDEWGRIRSVNFFLNNYQKTKELDRVEPFAGEARFFRAMFYFEQFLKMFGGVPWYDKELQLDSEELYAPRLPRHEVANNILADLDWAIGKIPSFNAQAKGRISKEVAMLYKARIALFEGTWEKYHAGTPFAGQGDVRKYLETARDAALAVINSGQFGLDNVGVEDGYHILFNQHSYANSREIMLWKEYNRLLGVTYDGNRQPGRNGASVGLSRWLVDSYLCIDTDGKAKPISLASNYQGDDNLLTVVANRDPRLSQTMFIPGRARTIIEGRDTTIIFTKSNINLTDTEKCSTGYELAKGADPDEAEQITISQCIKGSIIFRYAEALLIYAEARAELNELTQADLDMTINKLRDRVQMPHLTLDPGYVDPKGEFTAASGYQGVAVSNILQEVRRERRVELSCEGYRTDDLRRWRAHHLLNNFKIQGAKIAQFQDLTWLIDYFKTFPVPKAINSGYDWFMGTTVAQWVPGISQGNNYWIDDEGYFAPYQRFIPGGYFSFDPNKAYLRPLPTEQYKVLNTNLTQNPGWDN